MSNPPIVDQSKYVHDILSANLVRTSEWLKFAETKVAALLTFASAWILALSNAMIATNLLTDAQRTAIFAVTVSLSACAAVCLSALFPQVTLSRDGSEKRAPNTLTYVGSQHLSGAALYDRTKLDFRRNPNEEFADAYLQGLAVEITSLSRVAARKYKLFTLAIALLSASPAIGLLVFIYSYPAPQS